MTYLSLIRFEAQIKGSRIARAQVHLCASICGDSDCEDYPCNVERVVKIPPR